MSYLKSPADTANGAADGVNHNGKSVTPNAGSQPKQLVSANWVAPLMVGVLAIIGWDIGVRVTQ
ncbi:MAG: hypothetical protein AAF152_13190, partial [Cyanobacteria bacterium P01_A01_bin.114]